jgi:glycosyltransferase involved in cell wall biosynthesis
MEQTLSVVIPCYNEAGYLAQALRSLGQQSYQGSREIIVIDNNCTDATAGIAASYGARVVREPTPGVCAARQAGTLASNGQIVISTDADTTYPADWLEKIARHFATDDHIVAVMGPCRYHDGPLWGRAYARLLFGCVNAVYRVSGRVWYVTATNIAFRKRDWPGYDLNLPQGGDELDLLRKLRRRGKVVFDATNPTFTSGRRLCRGLAYNFFVTLLVNYLMAYWVNRLLKRRVLGPAPVYRDNGRPALARVRTAALAMAVSLLLVLPFAGAWR